MSSTELRRLAWEMARSCRRVIQTCLREEEWRDADEEFARIIIDGLQRHAAPYEGRSGGETSEQLAVDDLCPDRKRRP